MKIIDKLVIRYRLWKVVKKWNKDLSWIRDQIEKPYGSKESIVSQLKWEHLIFQEIKMRILLGIQVARKDFDFICDRRGFNGDQRSYLRRLLKVAGLDKLLEM